MAANDKEWLKQRIKAFLEQQTAYNENKKFEVTCDEGDYYFILYGEDIVNGVTGFGQTAESAFEDFVDNWITYRR